MPRKRKLNEEKEEENEEKPIMKQKQEVQKTDTLFIDNISLEVTEEQLIDVFKNSRGYKTLSLVPTKGKKVSFIEFENENDAELVMNLNQNKVLVTPLKITFAKK